MRRASRRLTRAGWNERVKLLATTMNALGLAIVGFGVLGPLLAGSPRPLGVQSIVCGAIFIGLHLGAQWLLRALED